MNFENSERLKAEKEPSFYKRETDLLTKEKAELAKEKTRICTLKKSEEDKFLELNKRITKDLEKKTKALKESEAERLKFSSS